MLDLLGTRWEDLWEGAETREARGSVYTRAEVVELILDLAGYDPVGHRRLAAVRVLEPGCGDGAFISLLVDRLLRSEMHHRGTIRWNDPLLDQALRAVDIDRHALNAARVEIARQLTDAGCPGGRATALAETWTVHSDFLLDPATERFDLVCGNPPYLRIEDVPKAALAEYRSRFATLTDRADLFVAFIEQGLSRLAPGGCLAFICANRFAKNQYGTSLRRLIAREFRVRCYLNLEHTQPFERDVSAYPAILIVDQERGAPTLAGTLTDVLPGTLEQVRAEALPSGEPGPILSRFAKWYTGGQAWVTTSTDERDAFDTAFAHLPSLEDSAPGTKVGIGVATGADRVFVLNGDLHGVEAGCLVPLARVCDVTNEGIVWSGSFLVNPFADVDDGSLVDLSAFPGLAGYLRAHADRLRARHVARTRPQSWYRTIDRVWRELQHKPKLFIPDIQTRPTVAYDPGEFYPHHGLYWITSDGWDLRALQGLLRSQSVYRQVQAHSVQMRGGSLRWQAQTLRRIRLPSVDWLPADLVSELARVSDSDDQETINALAAQAFRVRRAA